MLDLGSRGRRKDRRPEPHPATLPQPSLGVLTSCSSPFRRCSYSRICLNCFRAVSTLQPTATGNRGVRPGPDLLAPPPSEAPPPGGPPSSPAPRAPPTQAPTGYAPGRKPRPQPGPALTFARCASGVPSRSPACPARAPAGNSPSAPIPRSATSALLPS